MQELTGRTAVVTGGASGIGFAMAGRLGEARMKVVLADIERPALDDAAARLASHGCEVEAVVTDVSDADQVDALADRAVARFGAVHVVCNNAGVVTLKPLWEQSLEDWRWVLGVDLWGVIHGVRSFLPLLMKQRKPGHVVNTASIAGLLPSPGIGPYNVAKSGVVDLSETLRLELRELGLPIGVSVVCPGVVPTRIAESGRNRPGRAARDEPERLDIPTQTDLPKTALLPGQVADHVIDAIRADRFWVLTHPAFAGVVRDRANGIVEGFEPVAPPVL